MKSSLIVIDVQESFRHRPYFLETQLPSYLNAQNTLIKGAQALNMPIVRIFHSDGPELASNPWSVASGCLVPLSGLCDFTANVTWIKHKHSALVGTGMEAWLREQGIERLIVSGIRTEQCCETTTRHASDLGFEIDYVIDATLTFDMQYADGKIFTADDIKARTAAVLTERFARIASVEQALAA